MELLDILSTPCSVIYIRVIDISVNYDHCEQCDILYVAYIHVYTGQ